MITQKNLHSSVSVDPHFPTIYPSILHPAIYSILPSIHLNTLIELHTLKGLAGTDLRVLKGCHACPLDVGGSQLATFVSAIKSACTASISQQLDAPYLMHNPIPSLFDRLLISGRGGGEKRKQMSPGAAKGLCCHNAMSDAPNLISLP